MTNKHFRIFAVISIAIAIALSGYALHQTESDRANELHNRVANVHTWCIAINEGRKEGLRLHHKEKAYKIKLLDCHALEVKTEHSAGEPHR